LKYLDFLPFHFKLKDTRGERKQERGGEEEERREETGEGRGGEEEERREVRGKRLVERGERR
jgi:hypothetical protein